MMKMKKLSCLIILLLGIIYVAFSKNFFSERYFEMQYSIPFDISNNVFSLNDIFKEEVVIDLKEIANSVPKDGLNLVVKAKPQVGFNLNIAAVNVGMHYGLDIYEKMGISKDFFDFLGNGNEVGEKMDFALKNNTDVFFVGDLNVGIKAKRFSVSVNPSVFIPVFSVSDSAVTASFVNDEDGNIKVNLKSDISAYSNINFSAFSGENSKKFADDIVDDFFSGMGFDLAGAVALPFGKNTVISADLRVPIVPGSYKYRTSVPFEKGFEMNISNMVNNSDNSEDSSLIKETGDSELNFDNMKQETLTNKKYINRPLKIHAYANYTPFLNLVEFCAGGGLGVYHPFLEDAFVYPEYYFSAGLNLFNFVKAKLSTEYTDQIFKHQVAANVNLRLVEVECGVSLQSTNFIKSMEITGLGGYVIVSLGF